MKTLALATALGFAAVVPLQAQTPRPVMHQATTSCSQRASNLGLGPFHGLQTTAFLGGTVRIAAPQCCRATCVQLLSTMRLQTTLKVGRT